MRLTNARGASMLEMLFALLIAGVALPFAHAQLAALGENLKALGAAKEIAQDAAHMKDYLVVHESEFPANEYVKIETDAPNKVIYAGKFDDGAVMFVAHRGENRGWSFLHAAKIASLVGDNAAVVENDGAAYGVAGNWTATLGELLPGDIVYRVFKPKGGDETSKYLHRTILSDGELSKMLRDLSMGNFSISNAGKVVARKLGVGELEARLVKTPSIAATSLYFTNGLNLNPEKSKFPNMRVSDGVIGFRNIRTGNFSGGSVAADRATIADKLAVMKNFEVKSPYLRTVGGFAGASASAAKTPYLDAETLTFLPGFGITVSSELLYSSTPPIRLGNWSFPSGTAGPKFATLKLANLSWKDAADALTPIDFSEIIEGGWR